MLGFPPVLDACCGSRMFWFDKQDERALFVDKRCETWPIDIGTPGTKGRSPIVVAVYCPDDNGHEIYVRERGEFEEKFEPITTGA